MCRGIQKQKAWGTGRTVSTTGMERKQLHALMTSVVDPAVARKLRVHSREMPVERPIGGWRPHWVDHMHEPDGGEDTIGGRLRVGVDEMKRYMDSLYEREGTPEAWDDMSDVFLDPEAVCVSSRSWACINVCPDLECPKSMVNRSALNGET